MRWLLKNKGLKEINPKRMLPEDCTIDVNRLPLVVGKIHFTRVVDSGGHISVLNEYFNVGEEYIDEYAWATIETGKQTLVVYYKDKDLTVREIKKFDYGICEAVHDRKDSIFVHGL